MIFPLRYICHTAAHSGTDDKGSPAVGMNAVRWLRRRERNRHREVVKW
jgi:hypothetical protein